MVFTPLGTIIILKRLVFGFSSLKQKIQCKSTYLIIFIKQAEMI